LKSNKLHIVGHGIDTDVFFPGENETYSERKLLHVGRLSEVKQIHLMIDVLYELRKKGESATLSLVGTASTNKDERYVERLKELVNKKDLENFVDFVGGIKNDELVKWFRSHDIFLNFSNTGSLDKTVLEALSVGTRVVTSNEAFKDILHDEYVSDNDIGEVVRMIRSKNETSHRKFVVENHSLPKLIEKIKTIYQV